MASRQGRPNKTKQDFRTRLQAYATRHKVDPFFAMVKMLADTSTREVLTETGQTITIPTISASLKFACAKELAQYLQPKLRSVVVQGDVDAPLEVIHRYGRSDRTPG